MAGAVRGGENQRSAGQATSANAKHELGYLPAPGAPRTATIQFPEPHFFFLVIAWKTATPHLPLLTMKITALSFGRS